MKVKFKHTNIKVTCLKCAITFFVIYTLTSLKYVTSLNTGPLEISFENNAEDLCERFVQTLLFFADMFYLICVFILSRYISYLGGFF